MMLAIHILLLTLIPQLLTAQSMVSQAYEWPYDIWLNEAAEAGRYHLTASQLSEHFSIDVYPNPQDDRDYYLNALDMQWPVGDPEQTKVHSNIARLLNDFAPDVITGHPMTGNHVNLEDKGWDVSADDDKPVYYYIYHKDYAAVDTFLHFIKTEWLIDTIDDSFVEEPYEYRHL
ncbi:hypothetical protein KKA08_02335, partial [bacterium]|nr:hypothetical protein [bacterium]